MMSNSAGLRLSVEGLRNVLVKAVFAGGGVKGVFRCPRCARVYSVQTTLNRHMRYECGLNNFFRCGKCPKAYKRRYLLAEHINKYGHY